MATVPVVQHGADDFAADVRIHGIGNLQPACSCGGIADGAIGRESDMDADLYRRADVGSGATCRQPDGSGNWCGQIAADVARANGGG